MSESSANRLIMWMSAILGLLILGLILNGAVAQHQGSTAAKDQREAEHAARMRALPIETPTPRNHQAPSSPTNAYGLVTNGPDPLANKINDVLTRCLEASGTPKNDPTHRVTKQEFLVTTTCLDIAMGRHTTR